MFLKPFIDFITSLRLTVVCLAMAMVLVFVGTLAQVEIGLYEAQEKYFRSLFVFWSPGGASWGIPVWPGGYLLGTVLLVNLLAAHFKRFAFTKKKVGIFLIHAGLILLLLGQFLTEVLQVESNMRLEEGQTKNYTEDTRLNELAVIDVTDANQDKVIAIPESHLRQRGEISHPELPFTLRVQEYLANSWPGGQPTRPGDKVVSASQGVGQRLKFSQEPETYSMNDENKPTAVVEVAAEGKSLGTWTVSNWLSKHPWIGMLQEQMGGMVAQPQTIQHEGRTYQIALRPVRYYKPYSIHLIDFSHDRYVGTEIAKNFSSQIQLRNPETGEDREVLIYMNNPLRYAGETYYQGSFERGDRTSILHVVRNPAWLTPYLSCTLVGIGLLVQFLMHLFGFSKKLTNKPAAPPSSRPSPKGQRPAPAAKAQDQAALGAMETALKRRTL